MLTDYLDDPRDRVVLGETPALMQPLFGKSLPPPESGKHRFVCGQDGLYIEAQNDVIGARLKVAESSIKLPYGAVHQTDIHLKQGRIPKGILDGMVEKSKQHSPKEWAGLVVWDRHQASYSLYEPTVMAAGVGHISYQNALPDEFVLVMDVHSHGTLPAFFSGTDNQSDRAGFCIAGVIGSCLLETPMMASRLVLNGQFLPCPDLREFFGDYEVIL
jgi:PRTRC genetic system protein A